MNKNQKPKKIAVVIGTRPEAIKMAPVILELKHQPKHFKVVVISSGQHRQMLDDPLSLFGIEPDYDLNIMLPNQSLFDISRGMLSKMEDILGTEQPDLVLVQGDTTTAFLAGVAAFYLKIPVGHVEAGLRTYNKYHPFPEELNRQLIDVVADFYFVPTQKAQRNLIREGKDQDKIVVTVNTVIDAALAIAQKTDKFKLKILSTIDFVRKKVILLECHRRESWGGKMGEIFKAVKRAVDQFPDLEVIFPVHLNPIVRRSAKILSNHPRIHLTKTLDYADTMVILKKCYLVVTDSGGFQEEAPIFDKPVLVIREVTERPEGVQTGALKVVGTDGKDVYNAIKELINNKNLYQKMARAKNPFGDGKASQRIKEALLRFLSR